MFLPDRYVKGTCPHLPHARPVRRQLRELRRHLHAARPHRPGLGRLRHAPRRARVRAHLLQARQLRADAAEVDALGRAAGRGRQQARRVVRGGAARLGHLARRAVLRLRDPRRAGQVFLRLARRAGRLHGELRELLQAGRASTSRTGGSRTAPRSCTTSSARTSCISTTLFWPATLEGAGFRKPTAVHAHGFLTVNGEKMSKSRGTFVTARALPRRLPPEYFRYFLAAKLGPGARGHRPQPRGVRDPHQRGPGRQARQHREPLRELHPSRARRAARRRTAGARRSTASSSTPARASSRPGSRSSTRPPCARSWRSPTAPTSTSTARSPGSRPRTRRAPRRCRRSARRASTCSAS